MQKNDAFNKLYFYPVFFSYVFIPQILKNYVILINHRSFVQAKKSSQFYRFQFLEINSLMAETIKNQFSETKLLNLVIIYSFKKIGKG